MIIDIEWYYWVIMAFGAISGASSFGNFMLQRKWYKESKK